MEKVEIAIPSKPIQTNWAIPSFLGMVLVWCGLNVIVHNSLKMPQGTILDSSGKFYVQKVDYLTKAAKPKPAILDSKYFPQTLPENEYTARFNSEFFNTLDANARAYGVDYKISGVPEGIMPYNYNYFTSSKLHNAQTYLWLAYRINQRIGVDLIKSLNFNYSKEGNVTGSAEVSLGRISLHMEIMSDTTFRHEVIHLVSDYIGLGSNSATVDYQKLAPYLAGLESALPKTDKITQDTVFKILFFLSKEFDGVPEEFYNDHLNWFSMVDINKYGLTFSSINGANNELLSVIVAEDFDELFKPKNQRNEAKVTRFLKLMALLKYSFPNSDIWMPDTWRLISQTIQDLPIGNDYIERISGYEAEIEPLKRKIEVNTVEPKISAVSKAAPFSPQSFIQNTENKDQGKRITFYAVLYAILFFISAFSAETIFNKYLIKDFIENFIQMNPDLYIDADVKKDLQKTVLLLVKEKLTQEDFERILKDSAIITENHTN